MSWGTIFGVTNLVFLVFIGLPLFAVGILLGHIVKNSFEDSSFKIMQGINERVGVKIDVLNADFSGVTEPFKVLITSLGIAVTAICLLGVIGACCEFRPVLLMYFMIMLVVILAQLMAIMMFMNDTDTFDGCMKPRLRASIEDNYQGLNSSEITTITWNTFMFDHQCCGVDSYVDFKSAKQWKRGLNGTTGFQAPLICCHKVTSDYECALQPRSYSSYFEKGCYAKLKEKVKSIKDVIVAIAVVILGFQISLLCLEVFVMKSLNTNEWFSQGVLRLFCLGNVDQGSNKPV